ncbi:MAG: hypothetical protein GWN71_31360, partial [Gammaproteobacteria bacterium]|nr:hypothetical protein [Gemmatimonadota bacterium]NIU77890.1 hypothetical protein [Gammaproteobacteria bacterium]
GFAATFVLRDSVAMGPPGPNAGMAFVVGDYRAATGYFPIFFEAARYEPGDKRVLRWLDRAELLPPVEDREWVLRAYGDAVGWYEVVGLDGAGERAILWSSRRPVCEAQQPSDLAD